MPGSNNEALKWEGLDHYELLGLQSRNATLDEIKKAYKATALKNHHDKFPPVNGPTYLYQQTKFTHISAVYQTLSDSAARREYNDRLDAFNAREAAARQDWDTVRGLLVKSDLTATHANRTALYWAIAGPSRQSRLENVRLLIEAGAKIDMGLYPGTRITALHFAVLRGDNALVSELLNRGADTTIDSKGDVHSNLTWEHFDVVVPPHGSAIQWAIALLPNREVAARTVSTSRCLSFTTRRHTGSAGDPSSIGLSLMMATPLCIWPLIGVHGRLSKRCCRSRAIMQCVRR